MGEIRLIDCEGVEDKALYAIKKCHVSASSKRPVIHGIINGCGDSSIFGGEWVVFYVHRTKAGKVVCRRTDHRKV